MDQDMQKLGRFDHFPEETGCKSWFFLMSARTKIKCAINNSSPNSIKKLNKKIKFSIFKGYISLKEFSMILTINAPKWRRSAGTWKLSRNGTFSSTEAPSD